MFFGVAFPGTLFRDRDRARDKQEKHSTPFETNGYSHVVCSPDSESEPLDFYYARKQRCAIPDDIIAANNCWSSPLLFNKILIIC